MTRKRNLTPRYTTARDDRKTVFEYFPRNEVHSIPVKGGRCVVCSHITAIVCEDCMKFLCGKHREHECKPAKIDYAL